ncbi:MAG: hypothetical protein AUK35_05125 [Zetaproteobacteria bacterium CG2_30_46_52]|nr:MAG: hypothetical protein AUK35_05125 [Zetaproteobacteria bacterium CG2_30_46_52]
MNVVYIILFTIVLVLFVAPLRRLFITPLLYGFMQKKMPAISPTEQQAIDAGTVWWEKSLLRGTPDWVTLGKTNPVQFTPEEANFIDGPVEALCAMVNDWETQKRGDLSKEVWDFLKKERFFGMGIPRVYGGLEFCASAHSEIILKISSRSVTAAVTTMVPNSLGPAELLLHYGTDEQKDYYLPRLAVGDEVPCFALTGPDAGSDAGAIPDTGVVEKGMFEGEEVLGIRLNWNKRYITLAPVATLVGLAFHLSDPNHLLGETEQIGITVALIPANTEGVVIGRRHNPTFTPFQNGPTQGKDVFIPMSYIIGGQAQVGQGWRMLMESLAAGRAISLPALSTGTGKMACHVATAYTRVREQFGLPVGRFEGVSERLAAIAVSTYTVDATRKLCARAVDLGEKPSVLSAIAKYNATESMRTVINDTMDVIGGKGICVGPKNLLAHVYLGIPVGITVEGANILTRSLIVFGQGAIRCNPYLLAEIAAIQNPNKKQAIVDFDIALIGHMGNLMQGVFRAVRFGVVGGRGSVVPEGTSMGSVYQDINRLSAALSLIGDMSMLILGGKLKVMESLSGRLADALSALFQTAAVLKHYSDNLEPEAELGLVKAATTIQLYRAERALDEVLRNFPTRPAAWLMRLLTFPLGFKHRAPLDKDLHAISKAMLQGGQPRESVTQGIYKPTDETQALRYLELAMEAAIACESMRNRLKSQFGSAGLKPGSIRQTITAGWEGKVITQDEKVALERWLDLRDKVVAVDDFPAEEMLHEKA